MEFADRPTESPALLASLPVNLGGGTVTHAVDGDRRLGAPGADRLPERARRYMDIRDLLGAVLLATAGLVAAQVFLDGSWLTVGRIAVAVLVVSVVCLEIPVMNRLTMRWTTYTVTPEHVYLVRGGVLRRSTFIPTRQILSVETAQGPLLRHFDLAQVRFHCISEVESFGPLDATTVARVREAIALVDTDDAA